VRVVIGDVTYDVPVCRELRAWLEARGVALDGERFSDTPADSFERLVEQLSGVDLVVASRFHNLVLGFMLEKPAVSISYEGKNDALMAAMGLAEYCQPIDRLDLGRLREQFEALERSAPRLQEPIVRKVAEYRRLLDEQYTEVIRKAGLPAPAGDSPG